MDACKRSDPLAQQLTEVNTQLAVVQGRYNEVTELLALANGQGTDNAASASDQDAVNADAKQ